MNALRVRTPGLLTTVQDLGRVGFRRFGVPTSGVLDVVALRLANALVGNPADAAGLECLGIGPELEAIDAPVRIAFIGAAPGASILRGDDTRTPFLPGHSATLSPGDRVVFGALVTFGIVVAVEGGIDAPPVLGGRSTYLRGGFGGLAGRALAAGAVLPIGAPASARPEWRLARDWRTPDDAPIRVVLGPQDDAFTAEGLAAFLGQPYTITTSADRMGFRLEGATPIVHSTGPDIVSDGAVAGSVQVPGSGQPIVLLADGQSVGGYTKIATVISSDLPSFVRRRPGERVSFQAVPQAQAEVFAREHARWLKDMIAAIEPFVDGLNVQALYDRNLVSGVVAGT